MSLIKPWTVILGMVSRAHPRVDRSNHKQYTMLDARKAIKKFRGEDSKNGNVRQGLTPITIWILRDAIDVFIEEYSKDYILEKIEILDNREHAILS